MQMHTFSVCFDRAPQHPPPCPQLMLLFPLAASSSASSIIHLSFLSLPTTRIINSRSITARKPTVPSSQPFHANSPKIDSTTLFGDNDDASEDADAGVGGDNDTEDDGSDLSGGMELLSVYRSSGNDDIKIEIEEIGKNSRRIRSRIAIEASLQTVWNILTEYEKLADFIPGLAVSQLLERRDNFVRLFQIGQQKLAFGLSFNAKGIIDCYEKQLENLPFGQRRDIEFKMIEGDFKLFEGKWSIEQYNTERCEDGDSLLGQESHTTLSYVVDVEPKLWLPVRLVEGRLCREITLNLSCIRVEAQKVDDVREENRSFIGAVRSRPSLDKGSEEVVALNVQQLFEVNDLISSPGPAQPAGYASAVKGRSPPLPSPGTSSDTFSEFFSVRTPSKQAKFFF